MIALVFIGGFIVGSVLAAGISNLVEWFEVLK